MHPASEITSSEPSRSLASYLVAARAAHTQAQSAAPSRAASLHAHTLKLICEMASTHEHYGLSQSSSIRAQLRALAHCAFVALENAKGTTPSLRIGASALDLFRRVAVLVEGAIGILAGRAAAGAGFEVTALVFTNMAGGRVRYARDVGKLLEVKGLICLGVAELQRERTGGVGDAAYGALGELAADVEGAAALVVGQDATLVDAFMLVDGALAPAGHVEVVEESNSVCKMYDLRPLAMARDEEERGRTDPKSERGS